MLRLLFIRTNLAPPVPEKIDANIPLVATGLEIAITRNARARAVLNGRYYASVEDVRAVAHPVLRHRILTNFNAEAEGIDSDSIVDRLLEDTPQTAE